MTKIYNYYVDNTWTGECTEAWGEPWKTAKKLAAENGGKITRTVEYYDRYDGHKFKAQEYGWGVFVNIEN